MKMLKLCVCMLLVVSMFAGCESRNNNRTSTPSAPGAVSDIPGVLSEAEDNIEDFASDMESRVEDGMDDLESALDGSRDELSAIEDADEDESAAAAMSTDFTEIGALDAEKLGWGSGGPADSEGRPNGATLYQDKYGKYGAHFIVPTQEKKIYLTFDEGYENGFTPQILDTLKEKNVKAVFFITLDFAKRQPELVTRMVQEGHVLGNHSCKHLSFPDMSLEDAAEDIRTLHDYVKSQFGYKMYLFRPPMGEFSEQTLALAQSLGYKSVFWSFAYKDYDVDNQPITIEALDRITSAAHPGAIYLLHAVSQTNAEVLDEAIDNLRAAGYDLIKWNLY